MLDQLLNLIVLLAIIAGTLFSIIGVMGLIRMPDVYTRLHATGKVSVFGILFLLVAAMLLGHAPIGKGILLIVFLVVAGPALSHAVGSAAYRLGIPMKFVERNDLAERLKIDEPTPTPPPATAQEPDDHGKT